MPMLSFSSKSNTMNASDETLTEVCFLIHIFTKHCIEAAKSQLLEKNLASFCYLEQV